MRRHENMSSDIAAMERICAASVLRDGGALMLRTCHAHRARAAYGKRRVVAFVLFVYAAQRCCPRYIVTYVPGTAPARCCREQAPMARNLVML